MKYDINNLPEKVKVMKEIYGWKEGSILTSYTWPVKEIYIGLEAGILEPYDEEEEEQEKLREEMLEKIEKCENVLWIDAARKVLKNYKITKR